MTRLLLAAILLTSTSSTVPLKGGEAPSGTVEAQTGAATLRVGVAVPQEPRPRPHPHASRGGRRTVLHWDRLAQCESSGNPHARSGPYTGLYQFDRETWRSVGGTGQAGDATPAEQTARAQRLYKLRVAQPWPVCGRHLR